MNYLINARHNRQCISVPMYTIRESSLGYTLPFKRNLSTISSIPNNYHWPTVGLHVKHAYLHRAFSKGGSAASDQLRCKPCRTASPMDNNLLRIRSSNMNEGACQFAHMVYQARMAVNPVPRSSLFRWTPRRRPLSHGNPIWLVWLASFTPGHWNARFLCM